MDAPVPPQATAASPPWIVRSRYSRHSVRRPVAGTRGDRAAHEILQEHDPATGAVADPQQLPSTPRQRFVSDRSGAAHARRVISAQPAAGRRGDARDARARRADGRKHVDVLAAGRHSRLPASRGFKACGARPCARRRCAAPRARLGRAHLLAFSGQKGEPYETIRREYCYASVGERDAETAGISVPIFGAGQVLLGALTLAGPRSRIDETFIANARAVLLRAAARATNCPRRRRDADRRRRSRRSWRASAAAVDPRRHVGPRA